MGRPPTCKQPQPGWQYLKVVKHRSGSRLIGVSIQVVYGDPAEVTDLLGQHTTYIERTHLTTPDEWSSGAQKLIFFQACQLLKASCAWEDWVYNLTRPVKTLRVEVADDQRRWLQRSPAMAAGLTDHIWSIRELLMRVVPPLATNTK